MSNIHLYCTVDRSDRDPGPRDSNRFWENIRSSVRYQGWTDIEICMITCAICHFTRTVQKRFCILELIVRFLLQFFHHVSLLSQWNYEVILCCSIVNSVYSSVLFCHYTTIILQNVHCSKWRDFSVELNGVSFTISFINDGCFECLFTLLQSFLYCNLEVNFSW